MELASRIVSVLLGLVVAVFILWPITIPVGFGQAWWASKQIAAQSEPTPSPRPDAPAEPAAAPSPPSTPLANTAPSETSTQSTPAKPDEGKHALLAAERAEAERIAALNKDAKNQKDATPAAPPTATKLYYRVAVRDAGTLQSGGTTIRLIGITARDADAICKDKKGRNWRCGAAGKSALARLIHTRAVSCELPKSGRPKDFPARCAVAGTDLSTWVVRQGWALPADPAEPALAEAAEAAKKDGAGLWRAGDATLTPEAKAQ